MIKLIVTNYFGCVLRLLSQTLTVHVFYRGNWNGKKPYIAGRQCSRCPRGYRCQNGLCAKSAWK